MGGIVEVHARKRLGKFSFQRRLQIRACGEHAVIVSRRGPDLDQRTFGDQPLCMDSAPERTAYGASLGASIEDGANHFHLAAARVAMLADVAVEAESAVV